MQRLRVKFSRGESLKFLSHLDLMRSWERALRRAGFEIAYSEGYTPHPRLSLAAPLQVGVTGREELMDVWLERWVNPAAFVQETAKQLPVGLQILEAKLVSPDNPSLQSQVRFAQYTVEVESPESSDSVTGSIQKLLSAETLPWTHAREKEQRRYDLRKLVDDIRILSRQGNIYKLGMRLRCDAGGSGRPEQVALAIGFTGQPLAIERSALLF